MNTYVWTFHLTYMFYINDAEEKRTGVLFISIKKKCFRSSLYNLWFSFSMNEIFDFRMLFFHFNIKILHCETKLKSFLHN